ncbi:hypothetical protein [Thermoleptolyngbya sp. M55_K2018_002]|uniref:hypothetical protein n=1 Tax=Thermoleptolyngbya sp. M55_K2018_002 TaxID=2747808 RepID=UPI0019DA8DF5|nr:hypothetical protein [Thermoleptolyngbya sp. M55_K2018_002]HIK39773.1 hypothetical protein [Thermoleptolyngbya sp. M55_K2018_002]
MTQAATAQIAIGLIAKSLDQAIASLEELETEVKSLTDAEATRVALDLIAQRDRLDVVYDLATRVVGLLYPASEPPEPDPSCL